MNLHHRDGNPWDPGRYSPDDSDTWKCNGRGAAHPWPLSCQGGDYPHTGTVSYNYDRGRYECYLHGPVETTLHNCRH